MPFVFIIWATWAVAGWAFLYVYTKSDKTIDGFFVALNIVFVIPIISLTIALGMNSLVNKPVVVYACETFTVVHQKTVIVSRSSKNGGDYSKTIFWVGPNKYNFTYISTSIGDFIPEVVDSKIKVDIRTTTDLDGTKYHYQGNSTNCLK